MNLMTDFLSQKSVTNIKTEKFHSFLEGVDGCLDLSPIGFKFIFDGQRIPCIDDIRSCNQNISSSVQYSNIVDESNQFFRLSSYSIEKSDNIVI